MTKNGLGPQRAKSVGTEHGCPPSPARRATAKGMRHSTCNGDFGLLFCDLMGFTACDAEAGNPIPKTRHPRAMVSLRASEATIVRTASPVDLSRGTRRGKLNPTLARYGLEGENDLAIDSKRK